ncbi:hypothetical protein [Pedobacter sp. SL55]|uniref:hypothetical protein n=1 Tax=Pedobacter sp. SL55 TaxID=2995161 RepID=UPI00226E1497|nr:hypothetical protein [Pedobacter sp. SL55]WAC42185.1 hypothetical protein OVA16_07475 [Pedobacter sp. SL55]
MENFYNFQKNQINKGRQLLIENIQLLLYKQNSNIFEVLDYENDLIYTEPLLFAFFNASNLDFHELNIILKGYKDNVRGELAVYTNKEGRIYLPNYGWLITTQSKTQLLLKLEERIAVDLKSGENINLIFEPIEYMPNSQIELLKYPIELLYQCYYDSFGNLVNVEIEEITKKHRNHLYLAFDLIKKFIPEHYELIESVTRKIVVFNVDTHLRNSFATMRAQGIAFFNACQENYNEVFFIDDIAHQTGHLIFNALIYNFNYFVKAESDLILEKIPLPDQSLDTRDIHVIFHALYTYYTTFICLDACLTASVFENHKEHEALGRVAFYLGKCYHDLNLIENPRDKNNIATNLFTDEGLIIYNSIKEKFSLMIKKYGPIVKGFNLKDQPYNFNYSTFLKSNPLNEKI